MSYNDPLHPRRRRRRRATAAGALAALLSAVLYRCTDHRPATPTASPPAASQPAQPQASRDTRQQQPGAGGTDAAPGGAANRKFDFYLLALSLAPAFCEDGHQRKRECQALDAESFAATPLTLHGLWPENLRPESYPRDCAAGALQLAPALRAELRRWMPGEADGLATHEWRKHGACSGLAPNSYFRTAIDWTGKVNAAVGAAIRDAAGSQSTAATLRAAANSASPGLGDGIVFVCKNLRNAAPALQRRPYLVEVRVCLANDGSGGAPGTLLQCSQVQRRDQGCGGSFQVDAP